MTERDFALSTKMATLINRRWSTYDTRVHSKPEGASIMTRETLILENDTKDRKVKIQLSS